MIRQFEIDGVPTLLAPTGGPMHAGLVFRVGTADETLARAGVTHLLEHLALAPLGLADYHYNGATGAVFTYFHTQGSEQDIAAFLTAVCHHLHQPPMPRLEMEKEILRTEWSSRTPGAMDGVPLWRYGARDHGLTSYPEFGLPMLGPDDLRTWAARYFTRENAVLWIAGDRVPAGLRLPLPGGYRQPVPAASSALPQTPAYFVSGSRCVALDAVIRRRTAASVFAGVLERELFRSLRQEGGFSYTVTAGYEPRGDGYSNLRALADALPDKQDAVLGGFVDVLAKLAVGRIEQADLDAHTSKVADSLGVAEVHAAMLPTHAFNLLTGYPNLSVDEYRAELKAVTLADLHEVAQEVMGSALLMVPEGSSADWAGFVEAPGCSTHAVDGTAYRSKEGDVELRVGADGVSYVAPDGLLTVRYAECAAMLAWPDGARQLTGHDAISIRIEPTLFDLHPAAIQFLDSQIGPERRVDMPARPPEHIPQPAPPSAPTPAASAGAADSPAINWSAKGTVITTAVLAVLIGGLALLCTLGAALDDVDDPAGVSILIAVTWVLAVILALPFVRSLRRRR
ncbi:Predicted Zn-dependent peptidase [Micromonospora rhizosphaerae]|uniref:Predicted Zn-dependent peptidase n=1 Tax=Micromonospora rhizosphaerae TaxID=568872 RepID=A0A1C6T9J4_9ACTN|nr:insulinase family protein [Micromonospora rhizosphaerae]SCL38317.1 Predicted Zn-dependent peptidase [Micromonospora rhizosphaerae]